MVGLSPHHISENTGPFRGQRAIHLRGYHLDTADPARSIHPGPRPAEPCGAALRLERVMTGDQIAASPPLVHVASSSPLHYTFLPLL